MYFALKNKDKFFDAISKLEVQHEPEDFVIEPPAQQEDKDCVTSSFEVVNFSTAYDTMKESV